MSRSFGWYPAPVYGTKTLYFVGFIVYVAAYMHAGERWATETQPSPSLLSMPPIPARERVLISAMACRQSSGPSRP